MNSLKQREEVSEELWGKMTHAIYDCDRQFAGFLYYDCGINGYDVFPWRCGLRPVIFGKTLDDAIAGCEAFQYSVQPVQYNDEAI